MRSALLSLPAPGDRTMARLTRKVGLLAVRHLLTLPAHALPERPTALAGLQRALTTTLKRDTARVLAAVGSPDVLPWLLLSKQGLWPTDQALRAVGPNLLLALGTTAEAVLWDVPVGTMAAGGRRYDFDPEAQGLTATPAGVEVRLADGAVVPVADLPSVTVAHPIAAGVQLATWDGFPLSMVEDHPDKDGNAVDLGQRSVEAWTGALAEALALVERGLPSWHGELPATLKRLIPVGYQPERHLSASYREAPNTAWLTLHPNRVTLAEAIVHETQHGKLNTAMLLDPLLHNGRTFWTDSPVRPDLRPLVGVLLAVHAFIPVAALHHALAPELEGDRSFGERRAQVLASNTRGLGILRESAEPTALGARVLGELQALHDDLVEAAGVLPEPVSDEMVG